ncbi:iron dicitrate transport regulator FecR [Aquabacterium sp. A7-Y]|uniref:iron dicitrate transport regulator FecR n=1 Tax=Aquabacterium sp. A7-Y TaxID=1349605 RepID=UPI00223E0194|nr:iron dicitrate transport regulator FecR [Aquabacterium sp. A7-Y]MCW7536365.1 iron dicitrate transport regulator FecR [Aquabacterium sp. A7-Y]
MTTTHRLEGRGAHELEWLSRRETLLGAAAFAAACASGGVTARGRGNIVTLIGEALLNGRPLHRDDVIQSGDTLHTGPASMLVFVLGTSAFHLRQNTRLTLERGRSVNLVSALRLLTGGLVSVWTHRETTRLITTPTLTIGIRGTGVYTEARDDGRTYFCNCYGTVELSSGDTRLLSQSDYHQAVWAEPDRPLRQRLRPAQLLNHTDEELEFLAGLLGSRTRWQGLGRKGVRDGKGYMPEHSERPHPAQ